MLRVLVKLPVPVPSVVLLSLRVGVPVVFQHTPRTVMEKPPSSLMLPPEVAEVALMSLASSVVNSGRPSSVVKVFSVP